jgi:hypothetical protein
LFAEHAARGHAALAPPGFEQVNLVAKDA